MSLEWKLIPLLLLVGCSGAGNSDSCTAASSGLAAPCDRPAHVDKSDCVGGDLDAFCRGGACAGYADTLASLSGACDGKPSEHSVVRAGTCGGYRFIEVLGSGIGYKLLRFYDASGAVVAAQMGSDTNSYCNQTSFVASYGPVPCCEMVTTEVVCAHAGTICI
jgi:hypothetical protein